MRTIYLTFEAAFAIVSYWAGIYTFGLFARRSPYEERPDYATVIGALLFLAFGVLTTVMLFREFTGLYRQRVAARAAMLAMIDDAQVPTSAPTPKTPPRSTTRERAHAYEKLPAVKAKLLARAPIVED